ncbi:MAG: hypothetical protein M0Q01_03835 [Syntrophales bacterium]|jgi:hypothetical protein|nr:hypothetical protein [Syntrophales bacterium]
MLIFHAVENPGIIPIFYEKTGIRLNILLAYNNIKGNSWKLTNLYRDRINLLYLDSGAYSVYTGKSSIDVHGYLDYLKLYGHKYDACFNLDDRFDDPDHNLQNQNCLEKGLIGKTTRPIPVIHDKGNPIGEFEMYVGLDHLYIAIGSSGSRAQKDQLLAQAKAKYPDVKIHLFGDLDGYLLRKHRPFSADSATWMYKAGRGGGIIYWRPSENKAYQFNVGSRETFKGSPHIKLSPLWEEIRAFIHDTFGYEERDLFKYEVRCILNFYFFWQLENYLNSLDGK